MGGISENEGRLEVCFDQRWGTINGDGWTHTDTQVACRQLGYSTSGMVHMNEGWQCSLTLVHAWEGYCSWSTSVCVSVCMSNCLSSVNKFSCKSWLL